MKLLLFLSLPLILTNTAMSQINKGQFLVGGNMSFESIKNTSEYGPSRKTTNYYVLPNFGWFITSKFVGGLRLNITIYTEKEPVKFHQTNFSFSPFLRYYLLPKKQQVNILVDASYINSRTKNRIQTYPMSTQRTYGYSISAGPSVFLNQHVALEFLLGYKQTKLKDAGDNKNSTFNTSLGLQVHLGKLKAKGKV